MDIVASIPKLLAWNSSLSHTKAAYCDQVGTVPSTVFSFVSIVSRKHDSAIWPRTPQNLCALCVIQHYCCEQGVKECNRAYQKVRTGALLHKSRRKLEMP